MTRRALAIPTLCVALATAGCQTDLGQSLITTPPAAELPRGPELGVGAVQLGTSVRGEPIYAQTHGTGPRRLLIIGLIHGDEAEVYERFDDLWLRLTTAGYDDRFTLAGIATMNPDGYAEQRRGNARGIDLNRNWPAGNFRASRRHGPAPLSEPETAAVHRYIRQFGPSAVIVFHATAGGPFVDPDGPEPTSGALAEAFVRAARTIDPAWRVHADFTNPAGSMGSWFGLDIRRPILTVELRPGTPTDRALAIASAGVLAVLREMDRQPLQAESSSSSPASSPPESR